jgi:hypothetical protein
VNNKYWLVWNGDERSRPSVTHDTLESAKNEAMRLAGIHNKPFWVLEIVGKAFPMTTPVGWEEVK